MSINCVIYYKTYVTYVYIIYLSAIHNISIFVQFLSYSFFICISSVLLYYVLFHAVMFRYVCRTVSDGTWSQSIFTLTRNFSEKRKFIYLYSSQSTQINFSSLCVWITYASVSHKKAAFLFWRSIVSTSPKYCCVTFRSVMFFLSLFSFVDPKTRNLIQRKYQSSMVSCLSPSPSLTLFSFPFHSHTFAPLHHSILYICHTVLKQKYCNILYKNWIDISLHWVC